MVDSNGPQGKVMRLIHVKIYIFVLVNYFFEA